MGSKWLLKSWILPVILAICGLSAVIIVKLQPTMQHNPEAGFVTPVKVINIKRYSVRPAITGFGVVEPDILFEATAEISGKIVYVHPQLRDGAVLPKATEVIRIEQEDFQLALQQVEADLAVSQAKLRELKITLENTYVDLQLAKEKLLLAKKDLQRNQDLLIKRVISQSSVDAQQANVLKLQQEVQSLNSLLRTLPEQQTSLQAAMANAEATVRAQQLNLERTIIRMPFNARIAKLMVDENQYVSQGAILFSAQTTDKVLINAQFPKSQFQMLAKDFQQSEALIRQAFQKGFSSQLFTRLGLTAKVRLADDASPYWHARVERISSSLDSATRTLGVIVSVERPYEQIKPGIKPPLIEGMYTEVILQGKAKQMAVIPRDALHEGEVFICTSDNQLERLILSPTQLQGGMALFAKGLEAGERVIVSDLFPAVPGMALQPVQDEDMQQRITQWAEEH